MFDWLRARNYRPRGLGTPSADMRMPGAGVETGRLLKAFVSHRWGVDDDLHDFVDNFHSREAALEFDNKSLKQDEKISGVKGGMVDELLVKRELADLIAQSDVVIAPSKKMRAKSDWVEWELETAAISYDRPILFVDHRPGMLRRTRMIRRLKDVGAKVHVAGSDERSFVRELNKIRRSSVN